MTWPTPLPHLQLLTLLLLTNRALAFGRNDWRLHTIEKLLAQQGGGDSISIPFQPCWSLFSLTSNQPPKCPEEPEESDLIWEKQPQPDVPLAGGSLEHPFMDLKPITPLSKFQPFTISPDYRLPPSRYKLPITRYRQPPIDPSRMPLFWSSLSHTFPHVVDPVGRESTPSPTRDSRRYLQSYSHPMKRLFAPGDNDRDLFHALYRPETRNPPPYNPYVSQSSPEDILHFEPIHPEAKQRHNKFRGGPTINGLYPMRY